MTINTWPKLETFDRGKLSEAARQVSNGVLWLARVANSYVAARPDDTHLMLHWLGERQALQTAAFGDGVALELRLPALQLQFMEHGDPAPHVLEMEDHSPAEVEAWLLVELLHRGLDRDRFSKALPYSISGSMSGDAVKFTPEQLEPELAALTGWLQQAGEILGQLDRSSTSGGSGGGNVSFWPANGCLGVSLAAKPAESGAGGTQTAGFALDDEHNTGPHFLLIRERRRTVQSLSPEFQLAASDIVSGGLDKRSVLAGLRAAIALPRV